MTKAKAETPEDEPADGESSRPVADDTEKEATPEAESETRTLVYRGNADTFRFGELRIRPGEPFTVTADVAEDLLTYPRERFEEVSQE